MKTDFTLFSEMYNCYYQVVRHILDQASLSALTEKQMMEITHTYGYQESALSIIPSLIHGDWPFLEKAEDLKSSYKSQPLPRCSPLLPARYRSRLGCLQSQSLPLTSLQKAWLKSLLSDPRIRLFLTDQQLSLFKDALGDTKPLFHTTYFHSFDQYRDHDPFTSIQYRAHFRTLLQAIEAKQWLTISYLSGHKRTFTATWLPCRLEYGEKEGKFRLFCIGRKKNGVPRMDVLNVGRILKIEETGQISTMKVSIDTFLDKALCREPLVLEITDQRNALERTMLHFSCYQKKVERLSSSRYRCSIYYDKRWETELLIQVLSFGPVIQVMEPEVFLHQVTERVSHQPDSPLEPTAFSRR